MKWTVRENILANYETAVCIYNQQIIQRHWNNIPQAVFVSLSHTKSAKRSLISTSLTHHFFVVFPSAAYFIFDDKDSNIKLAFVDRYGSPKALKIGEICTWGGSVGLGDNNCHIRVFRLLSLLELILKKCKSSSNAVNNNYQVTTKVYA